MYSLSHKLCFSLKPQCNFLLFYVLDQCKVMHNSEAEGKWQMLFNCTHSLLLSYNWNVGQNCFLKVTWLLRRVQKCAARQRYSRNRAAVRRPQRFIREHLGTNSAMKTKEHSRHDQGQYLDCQMSSWRHANRPKGVIEILNVEKKLPPHVTWEHHDCSVT